MSGASGEHQGKQPGGMNRIGIGMVAAEVGQRDPIDHRSRRSAKPAFQNRLCIGTGDRMHAVETEAEAGRKELPDAVEVDQALHHRDVVGNWIDDLDRHQPERRGPDRVERRRVCREDAVGVDRPGAREDRVGDQLRRRTAIGDVELQTEIAVFAAGIMAGRQDEAAKGAARADKVRDRRRRQHAALSHDGTGRAIRREHEQDDADRRVVEEPPVAADHDRVARDAADAVDHGLDVVLQIARLTEDGRLLAEARCSGPLPGDRPGRNRLNGHVAASRHVAPPIRSDTGSMAVPPLG